VQPHDDLPVVVPADSVDKIRGATLDLSGGGMVLDNPNTPSPTMGGPTGDVSGPVAQRVIQVLDQQVNPSIAAHGGHAELVAVEEETAYLRLGGGCVGCGMANVTLTQGIDWWPPRVVPEIRSVVDVTDHASGTTRTTRPQEVARPRFRRGPLTEAGGVLGGVAPDHLVAAASAFSDATTPPGGRPGSRRSSGRRAYRRTRLTAQPRYGDRVVFLRQRHDVALRLPFHCRPGTASETP